MDELDNILSIDPATLQIEELAPVISKKTVKKVKVEPKENVLVDVKVKKPSKETTLEALHRVCKECYGDYYDVLELTSNDLSRFDYESDMKYQVSLKFEDFNINNKNGRTHFIHGIYVIFYLTSDFKLKGQLRGFRHKVTKSEVISFYGHSHFNNGVDLTYWANHFCLGDVDTQIWRTFIDYREQPFDENKLRKLLLTIMGYIQYESLEGGPYKKIGELLSYKDVSSSILLPSIDEFERLNLAVNSPSGILSTKFGNSEYLLQLKNFSIFVINYLNSHKKNYLTYTIENNGVDTIKLNLTVKDIEDIYVDSKRINGRFGRYFVGYEVIKVANNYYSVQNNQNRDFEDRLIRFRRSAEAIPLKLSTGPLRAVIVDDNTESTQNLETGIKVLHPLISVNIINHIKQLFIQYKLNKK